MLWPTQQLGHWPITGLDQGPSVLEESLRAKGPTLPFVSTLPCGVKEVSGDLQTPSLSITSHTC